MVATAKGAVVPTDEKGALKRPESGYRSIVRKGGQYPPEAGRYHLYVSYACPWANRTLAVIYMKGLEDIIGASIVHSTMQRTRPDDPIDEHIGWVFANTGDPPLSSPAGFGSFPAENVIPDTVNGAKSVRDLYDISNKNTGMDMVGRYSVPVFWDKKTGTILNNESSEIIRFLNSEFNDLAKNPELDLYPELLRKEIDSVNGWVYDDINNGVYKCGFATQQAAYEEAFDQLFTALDRCEDILSKQRYIAGNQLTEADIRLFMTLIRFDEVYYVYFKTNKQCIWEYPSLMNYVRDIYQTPGVGKTIKIKEIKRGYYSSHTWLNHYAIIPKGREAEAWWEEPHNRHAFSA